MSSDTGPGGAPQKTVAELLAMYGESGGGRRRRRRENDDLGEPVAVPEQGYAVSRELPSAGYGDAPPAGFRDDPLSGDYRPDQSPGGYLPEPAPRGFGTDALSGGYQRDQRSGGHQRDQARAGWPQQVPPAGLSPQAPPIGPGRRARREAAAQAAAQAAAAQPATGYAPVEPYGAPVGTSPVGTSPVPAQQPPAQHPSAPLARPPRGSRSAAAPVRDFPTDELPRYVEPTPATEERPRRRRNGASRPAATSATTALDPGLASDGADSVAPAATMVTARAGRSSRAAPPEDLVDDDGEPYPDFSATAPHVEPSGSHAWASMVAQWIAGAIGGAVLWVVFRYLWQALPVVAIAAALLATAGLVLLVRAIRRSEDWQTTALAVLVGLAVTVSPAVLWLFGP